MRTRACVCVCVWICARVCVCCRTSVTGIVNDHVLVKTDDLHTYMSECVTSVTLQVSRWTGCAAAERGDERENRNHLSDGFFSYPSMYGRRELQHYCTKVGSITVRDWKEIVILFIYLFFFFNSKRSNDLYLHCAYRHRQTLWSISHTRTFRWFCHGGLFERRFFFFPHWIDFTF